MFPGGVSSADPWPYPAESELPSYVPTAEVPGGEETLTSTSCVPSIPRTIAKQSRAMPRCSEYPKSLKTTDSLQQDSTRCEPFRAFERKFSVTNNQVSDTGLRHLNSKSKDLQTVIESRTESEAEVQLASQCIGTRSLDSGFPSSGCRFPSNGCQSSEYVYTTSVPVLRPSHPESQETSSFGTASNQCTSGYSPAVPSSLAGVLLSPENLLAKSLAPLVPSPLTRRSARIPALQPGKPGAPGFPSSTVPSLNISSRRERRWQAYPSPTLGHSPFPEVSNGHEGTLGSSNLCATCSATTVLPTLLTPQQHYSEATKRSISHSFSPDEGSRSSSAYTPFSSHGEESSRSEPSLKSEALSILSLDPLKAEDLTVIDLDNIGGEGLNQFLFSAFYFFCSVSFSPNTTLPQSRRWTGNSSIPPSPSVFPSPYYRLCKFCILSFTIHSIVTSKSLRSFRTCCVYGNSRHSKRCYRYLTAWSPRCTPGSIRRWKIYAAERPCRKAAP